MADKRQRIEGEVLDGRYRLGRLLGRGGFGDVWRAEELLPDGSTLREVALKLLHASVASAPDWSAEARIIASLRHPALVTVYAAGVLAADRPIPFVAMELLAGGSLSEFVARGERVPWRRVLAWVREAAAALDVIHRAGVVHLDLKPANLFLSDAGLDDGGLKVLDFGIARQALDGDLRGERAAPVPTSEMETAAFMVRHDSTPAGTTRRGGDSSGTSATGASKSVVGTPGFMAPEVFEDGEASPATDAYALAACFVQLTTGRLPQKVGMRPPSEEPSTSVGAWFAELQAATVRGQIRDLDAEHPELPEAVRGLVRKWLALDPAHRGVAPGSLRDQLDAVWRRPFGAGDGPYRGLATYRAHDEGMLFGRAPEIARITRELADQPGAVLYGDSAMGLSSLAVAGIVPELARLFADGKHDWVSCEVALRGAGPPDDALASALTEHLARHGAEGVDAASIDEVCAWAAAAPIGTVLVIHDLEELLATDAREAFAAWLVCLAEHTPGLRVVATLHAEHVAAITRLPDVGAVLRPWLRFIGPMQAALVGELVTGPAQVTGRAIDGADAVVEELEAELGDGSRLPLLSLALAAWFAEGPSAEAWRAGGGVLGRARRHADAAFARMPSELRGPADAVLLRLVSVDGDALSVPEEELERASLSPDRHGAAVDALVRERLVVRHGSAIRLAHIGLATTWPHLSDLRLHHLERLTFLEELRGAARRWAQTGRARKHLWPADQLRELSRRGHEVAGELGEDERAFVAESERARRIGWLVRGAIAAVCFVAVFAVWLVNLRMSERERAAARELLEARRAAALGRMVTASRRTGDPYQRVALLAGAIGAGSTDPMLPLELFGAARGLPAAEFLSLQRVARPDFPWGERWLVGSRADQVVLFDFAPPAGPSFAPFAYRFRPHDGGLADVVPLAWDSSVLTRDHRGEVKIWRLRETGQVALAARLPEKCPLGQVAVAARAPVVACSGEAGLVSWDARKPGEIARDAFVGRVLDVSEDGAWVVAAGLRKLLLWRRSGPRVELELPDAPSLARVSPRDAVVAVVHGAALEVLALADPPAQLVRRDLSVRDPVALRWAPRGLDVAVCDHAGSGVWHYLRNGKRAAEDPLPPPDARPCVERREQAPRRLDGPADYGEIAQAQLGPRLFDGGFQRKDGTLVTQDLAMFQPGDTTLRHLVQQDARDEDASGQESVSMVLRVGDNLLWQIDDDIRVHDRDGKQLLSRPGQLLAACPDGRVLGGVKADGGALWWLGDPRHDLKLGSLRREPGFLLGADPGCHRVFVQALDGRLLAREVAGEGELAELAVPGGAQAASGYAYDVRKSPGGGTAPDGEAWGPGLWLALSEGGMLRVDGESGRVRPYGHATPRATAMANGPAPGDLLFADDRGVILRHGAPDRDEVMVSPLADRVWEDLALSPDKKTLWLSWAHGVTVVDVALRDVVGELEVPAHDRFTAWDDGGSLLLWPFSFKGPARGYVIPIATELALAVGTSASNIRAELGAEDLRAVIRLAE
jgi:hypothetical protein